MKNSLIRKNQLESKENRKVKKASVALFVLSLLIYFVSCSPYTGWGDSADLAIRSMNWEANDLANTNRDYLLYRSIAWLTINLPFNSLEPAYSVNLLTAFFGAIGVGIISYIAGTISKSAIAAIGAGLSLCVSHSYWLLSSMAEVYTFNIALSYGSLLFLILWAKNKEKNTLWIVSAVLAGLALSHHASGIILIIINLIFLNKWSSPNNNKSVFLIFRYISISVVFAVIYFARVNNGYLPANSLLTNLQLVSNPNIFYQANIPRELVKFILFLSYNFIGISIIIGLFGIFISYRDRISASLPIIIWPSCFIITGIISSMPDKFNIYVMVYPAFSIFVGIGISYIMNRCGFVKGYKSFIFTAVTASILYFPPIFYYAFANVSSRLQMNISGARTAPLRDNNWYFLWPPKNKDINPQTYSIDALKKLKPGDILLSDYTLWRPLQYIQNTTTIGKGVKLVFVERYYSYGILNFINDNYNKSNIYLATNRPSVYYQLKSLERHYNLKRKGYIFKIIKK